MNQKEQIFITGGSFQVLHQFLSRPSSSCFVLVDENTLKHCYPVIQTVLPEHLLITLASGEQNKTLQTCSSIWTELTKANADRKSLFINLGGGVISDMGGFSAACYKRGIPFINIPTTLLSMVDASVGGKTGIDFLGFKNQIGLFSQPEAVFVFTDFLKTLPQRELASGFAEVIKHYLIADKEAFTEIQKSTADFNALNWPQLVERNINIKSTIVEQDPHENSVRKALNFGHTIGHAVESIFLNRQGNHLLHGEAIAVGMLTESYISMKMGLLEQAELKQIEAVIQNYFVLPHLDAEARNDVLRLVKQDKKNVKHKLQFTLLQGIGNYSINNTVEEGLMTESLTYYNSLLK